MVWMAIQMPGECKFGRADFSAGATQKAVGISGEVDIPRLDFQDVEAGLCGCNGNLFICGDQGIGINNRRGTCRVALRDGYPNLAAGI